MDEVSRAEQLPWLEAEAQRLRTDDERENFPNPIVRLAPDLTGSAWSWAQTRSRLHLLRTRIRFQLTGEILTLKDPYGDVLQSETTPTLVKFWSVGTNGRSETGLPGPAPNGTDDIVVEVPLPIP